MSNILEFIYEELPESKGRIDNKISISPNEIVSLIRRYSESQKSAIPLMDARDFIKKTQMEVYRKCTENGKEFCLLDVIFIAEEYHKSKSQESDSLPCVSDSQFI